MLLVPWNPFINLESRKERSRTQILDVVAASCVVLDVGHVLTGKWDYCGQPAPSLGDWDKGHRSLELK